MPKVAIIDTLRTYTNRWLGNLNTESLATSKQRVQVRKGKIIVSLNDCLSYLSNV
jgi:hypothetical protein